MQIRKNLFFLAQLFVLTTCQGQQPEDGINLYLKSRMKEFPAWLQATGGDTPLVEPMPIHIMENHGFIELNGQLRDLKLTGHTDQYITTSASFFDRRASVSAQFFPNLEITGNYSLRGRASYRPISGQGVFKMNNFRYSDSASRTVWVHNFGITADGRIDLSTAGTQTYGQMFQQSLPEFEGLQSAGYEKHIQKSIKRQMGNPFQQYLNDRLQDYVRGVLEEAYLPTILHDNYDGNLYSRFSFAPLSLNDEFGGSEIITPEP